jgi:hypothetical protein
MKINSLQFAVARSHNELLNIYPHTHVVTWPGQVLWLPRRFPSLMMIK